MEFSVRALKSNGISLFPNFLSSRLYIKDVLCKIAQLIQINLSRGVNYS